MKVIIEVEDSVADIIRVLNASQDENGDTCFLLEENPGITILCNHSLMEIDYYEQKVYYLTRLGHALMDQLPTNITSQPDSNLLRSNTSQLIE